MSLDLTSQEISELQQITEDGIRDSPMMEHQKEMAIQTLKLANQLDLTVCQPRGEPCYCVMHNGRVWRILNHDSYSSHPMQSLKDFFEFMIAYLGQLDLDTSGSAQATSYEELAKRAQKIGNEVWQRAGGGYLYARYRSLIPGTSCKFYFMTKNALDPKRQRLGYRYYFGADELGELARWIAHDEVIFAKCNREHGITQD